MSCHDEYESLRSRERFCSKQPMLAEHPLGGERTQTEEVQAQTKELQVRTEKMEELKWL